MMTSHALLADPVCVPVILLVDDDPHALAALSTAIRGGPWRVLTAGSARAALATLERETVDVLVTDERMPYMSGSELCAFVREQWPETGRVLFTGAASMPEVARALNHGGISKLLLKPVGSREFHQTLYEVLDQAREARRALNGGRR